jgi:hypothetical protein
MGEIWDGSGKLRTSRNLGPERDLIGLTFVYHNPSENSGHLPWSMKTGNSSIEQ